MQPHHRSRPKQYVSTLTSMVISPLPLTNLSSLIHFSHLRYPILPIHLVCESLGFYLLQFQRLVSHYTDTPIHIFPLSLALSTIINNHEHK